MKTPKEQDILQQLSTEQKVQLTTGCGSWNTAAIPQADVTSVTFSDGPVGLRKETEQGTVPAVCFPSISKLACSFDAGILREVGAAIGEQCRQEGVNVLLAPGLNVKRNVRCGRNFEYFSEDPLLTAELASAYITGVNSQEVGVCVKHFACNSQEYGRRVCDSVVDQRALREIYLAAFERVIKKCKPCAVMCAYNKLNGEYCSQNKWLLTDVLRKEWGFSGAVISDWGATDDRAKGIAAGLDLEMPQGDVRFVEKALADGTLSVQQLDYAAGNVVQLAKKFHNQTVRNADYNYQHNLVRRISADCTVLVKNNCKLLPFSKDDEIALIGALCETPYFQGGGSSKVQAYQVDSLKQSLQNAGIDFRYEAGYNLDDQSDEQLLMRAQSLAASCPKVLLVVGGYGSESEGADRDGWTLPKCQLDVIDAVTSANSNVAIVLQSGAPVDVSWHHSSKALLIDYLGGEYSGGAICDVVFGDVYPTGRLAETWPLNLPKFNEEYSADYKRALYKESIFVGYRYYTTANVDVAFPFGYGLNYADIRWENVAINCESALPMGSFTISLEVSNLSKHEDADTIQVYMENVDSRNFHAKKNLVAFKKVRLKGGEKKKVTLDVNVADFAWYNAEKGEFTVNGGKYVLTVCRNVNDAGHKFTVEVECENTTTDKSDTLACYYNVDADFAPTDQQFEALYGAFPQEPTLPFTFNSPLVEISGKRLGKFLIKHWVKGATEQQKRTLMSLPLIDFVGGNVSRDMIYVIVDILNGGKFKLYFKLLKMYLANKKANKKHAKTNS